MERWIYVVNYKQDGKIKQREFDTKEEAQPLLERLKRNKVEYQFSRSRLETKLDKLLGAKLKWFGCEVYLIEFMLSAILLTMTALLISSAIREVAL